MQPKNDIIHDFEVLAAHLGNMAILLKGYLDALIEQGFERNEALTIVINYQRILLAPSNDK